MPKTFKIYGPHSRTKEVRQGVTCPFCAESNEVLWPMDTGFTYHRFSDMADDVVNVRIYQGIHFRSADEVARRHGTRLADLAFSHFLRPLHE